MKIDRLIGGIALSLAAAFSLHAQVPQIINYQGRVLAGTTNFNGSGQFKFALVDATGSTTFWSNDNTSTGGSEPTGAVSLSVSNGLYSVLLGDTSIPNMTVAIPFSAFTNSDVRLRVWFNDGTHGSQLLSPDQRIAAVGYAVTAASAASVPSSGLTGIVSVTHGGTGSATSSGALTNLGAAATSGNLAQFAPTTSAQLAGILSDENGTGLVVFHNSPGLTSPTISGQMTAAVGSAVNPTYGFVGDLNTGMFSSALDTINFATAGASRMSISPAGVVSAATFSGSLSGNATSATSATNVSGVVATANGGTGLNASGASGNILQSNGIAWTSVDPSSGLTLGQSLPASLGTLTLSVPNNSSFALIPGLTRSITVPANSLVYVETDGGIQTTSASATGFSETDIAIFVDGVQTSNGGIKRIITANNGGGFSMTNHWSFAVPLTLTAGNHTIEVQAGAPNIAGAATANVSGSSSSVLRGKLIIMILKQ